MARTKGSKNKMTIAVKDAIEHAFKKVNGKNNAGLIKLADEHPAIFYGLVSKCIPAAVSHELKVTIDLGLAIQQNEANLQRLNVIDITPSPTIDANPLITNNNTDE